MRPILLEVFFLSLVIGMSLTPLVIRVEDRWDGYGSFGAHVYNNRRYHILYREYTLGFGKPEVSVWDGSSLFKVPLVELSDHTSRINGHNIFRSYGTQAFIEGDKLTIRYTGLRPGFTKTVEAEGGGVKVTYMLDEVSNLTLTFWRWYFEAVGGVNKHTLPAVDLDPSRVVNFAFEEGGRRYVGEIRFSAAPLRLRADMDEWGINKVVATFKVGRLTVELSVVEIEGALPIPLLLARSTLSYPISATFFTIVYIGARVYGSRVKVRITRSSG